MKIAKSTKSRYDACILYLKQADLNSSETKCNSLSMFGSVLNYYSDAKRFAEYCKSLGENDIAKYAVRGWE